MSDLKEQVQAVVNLIENGYALPGMGVHEYLEDVLEITYEMSGDKRYLGARLLVAFGGPNIWVDTRTQTVEGYWWGEKFEVYYHTDELGLHEACEEIASSLFDCV